MPFRQQSIPSLTVTLSQREGKKEKRTEPSVDYRLTASMGAAFPPCSYSWNETGKPKVTGSAREAKTF